MKIVKQQQAVTHEIGKILDLGGLVIFPCETVYGAAVDATNKRAVGKLGVYKQRLFGKPYSIMCSGQDMAEKYANLNNQAIKLYKNFLPGPLTIISSGKHILAPGVESEIGTIGVRIPDYPFLLKLIREFGKPLTATSANAGYKKRPYTISDVLDNLSEKQKGLIDLIIDAGKLPHNEPSTVIDTTLDDPVILRQGTIRFTSHNSILTRSEEETKNCGKELWQKFEKFSSQRAIIFALEGPMGAGKTALTKGLAKAIGIEEDVVSPTYNLELDYGRLKHFDAWRMQNGEELENLGLNGLINDKSIIVVEWADRAAEVIRKYNEEAVVVWVRIKYEKMENERNISWGTL